MSYAKEKAEIERRIKRAKRVALCAVVVLIVCLCVFASFYGAGGWKYRLGLPKIRQRQQTEMRLHFINVGQGDSTLVEFPDGQTMLVDGGNGSDDSVLALMRYVNALGIETLDHLVVTHADYDHYGGISTVLDYKTVKSAYLPKSAEQENPRYAQFLEKLNAKCSGIEYANRDTKISVDDCTVAFMYPRSDDTSVPAVMWLDYKGVSVLLTSDSDKTLENFCMQEDKIGGFDAHGIALEQTEILKVGHHGSEYATDAKFVEYLGVETAIISCGANNAYGHPSKYTLDTLNNAGVKTYRTDRQGNVCVTVRENGTYSMEFL